MKKLPLMCRLSNRFRNQYLLAPRALIYYFSELIAAMSAHPVPLQLQKLFLSSGTTSPLLRTIAPVKQPSRLFSPIALTLMY